MTPTEKQQLLDLPGDHKEFLGGFSPRKIRSDLNLECACNKGGYCYATDKDNKIVRPCELPPGHFLRFDNI